MSSSKAILVFVSVLLLPSGVAGQGTPPAPATLAGQIKPADHDKPTEKPTAEKPTAEKPTAEKPTAAKASSDGFTVVSADGTQRLRLGGYLQVDGRFFAGESGKTTTDTFAVRRARPILEARLGDRFGFRLVTDFGEGKVAVQDAWLDTRLDGHVTLRAGKMKTPLGLERLASDAATFFAERGLPTELVPNRDVGFVLNASLAGGRVEASAGVLNGVVDGAATDLALNDGKEVAARVFVKPFSLRDKHPLKGLGMGFAATSGEHTGSLGAYRTPALQPFFAYGKSTVADGNRVRISPQASFHGGPVGMLAEYVRSSPTVKMGEVKATLDHEAWQVAAGVILTGESASAAGVKPRRPLGSGAGAFGALELVARYGALRLDPDTFSLGFASANRLLRPRPSPSVSASTGTSHATSDGSWTTSARPSWAVSRRETG